MIDEKLIERMREAIKLAKEKGKVSDAVEAFKKIPPEGIWEKDENGRIII